MEISSARSISLFKYIYIMLTLIIHVLSRIFVVRKLQLKYQFRRTMEPYLPVPRKDRNKRWPDMTRDFTLKIGFRIQFWEAAQKSAHVCRHLICFDVVKLVFVQLITACVCVCMCVLGMFHELSNRFSAVQGNWIERETWVNKYNIFTIPSAAALAANENRFSSIRRQ